MKFKIRMIIAAIVFVVGVVLLFKSISPFFMETAGPFPVWKTSIHYFGKLTGPKAKTTVAAEQAPDVLAPYQQGSASRLAVFVTDPKSPWRSLVHGLKTMGIPVRVTMNYREAVQHKVMLVYPEINGVLLKERALNALRAYPQRGGVIIAVNVVGGGLQDVFGFNNFIASRKRYWMNYDTSNPLMAEFTHPLEKSLRLGIDKQKESRFGTYAYTGASLKPLATYEDSSAAIVHRPWGSGHAYAFGINVGHYIAVAHNNQEDGLARRYVNGYEPGIDTLLRLVKNIWMASSPQAVRLYSVPFNKDVAVIFSHDIDYLHSMRNAVDYARYEKSQGFKGTYFIQTKYVRDYNDENFFNDKGVDYLKQVHQLGMEIASHSVSHSRQYAHFPLGSGKERYPSYAPFIVDAKTTHNGTVLGELRVSKFLLESHLPGYNVVSFRPGFLSLPPSLAQAMSASDFKYSSSVTAPNALTNMPFQLMYNQGYNGESNVFEFPVTIEDEEGKMGERVQAAVDVARELGRYGAQCMVLIHPDILDHKLAFEQQFYNAVKEMAWVGSLREFGNWWTIRNSADVDVVGRTVHLGLKNTIDGLVLEVPRGWTLGSVQPSSVKAEQQGNRVILSNAGGKVQVHFN